MRPAAILLVSLLRRVIAAEIKALADGRCGGRRSDWVAVRRWVRAPPISGGKGHPSRSPKALDVIRRHHSPFERDPSSKQTAAGRDAKRKTKVPVACGNVKFWA